MSQNIYQEPSKMLGKKRYMLPEPCFKKPKVFIEDEINDIMPAPQKISKKDSPTNQNILIPKKSITDIINQTPNSNITLIYKSKLLCQFICSYNFISRSVFEIAQLKTFEEVLKVKLCCGDVEHTGKLISKEEGDYSTLKSGVGIIENSMNEVYMIFRNENQFDWTIFSSSDNEYVMYKITNLQKIQSITNKPLDLQMLNKPLLGIKRDGDQGKVAISQLEYKSVYKKLIELKIEVPLDKKRYEDRLLTHAKNLEIIKAKAVNPDFQKKINDIKDKTKESLIELEAIKEEYDVSQSLYDTALKKLDCQEDIFNKISRSVIEEKATFENIRLSVKAYNIEIEALHSNLRLLNNKIEEKTIVLENLNKSKIETIGGCVFEVIPSQQVYNNKEDEYKLVALEEQYDLTKCWLCYQNARDCLFFDCNHLFCCKECVLKEPKNTIKSFQKSKFLRGKIVCPYCQTLNQKCILIAPNS